MVSVAKLPNPSDGPHVAIVVGARMSRRLAWGAAVRLLLVVFSYLATVVWLTWPLARLAFSHLPCTGPPCTFDTVYSTWVLAWESHALWSAPLSLMDGNIFHPDPRAVLYGPAGLGALPYFTPPYAVTGSPAFAMNFTLILCTALTAVGLHLVVVRWTGRHAAGAVAGATFLANRYVLDFVGSSPHLAPLLYFPFIILLAATRHPSTGTLLTLLALVVLQSLADLVYVAPAVFGPLGLLAVLRLARPSSRRDGVRLLLVLAAAAVLLSPAYLGYLTLRASQPQLAEQTHWKVNSFLPFGFDLAELFWAGPVPTTVAPVASVVILAGAIVALWRRRRPATERPVAVVEADTAVGWRHALFWALVGALLSIPPSVRWGDSPILVPQTLIERWTPLYDVIRAPSRLGIAALMGLCLLAGLGYDEIARVCSRWVGGWRNMVTQAVLVTVVLALIYGVPAHGTESIGKSYEVRRTPEIPPSMRAILASGREPLLKLPALDRRGRVPRPGVNAGAMYQSIFHWRPLLNGYSSYWPANFMPRMRLAERLPDRQALAELVETTGVALVWVNVAKCRPGERVKWLNPRVLARRYGLDLIAREGPQLLFAVKLQRDRHEDLPGKRRSSGLERRPG